jgi:trimeric autotransporter adhesin
VTVHDDGSGSALWAVGDFTHVGGLPAAHVARWSGSAWSSAGAGTNGSVQTAVGLGSELFVGGGFTVAGTSPASNVARWDGSAWSALGSGLPGLCSTMEIFDGPAGPQLHAAYQAGFELMRVARWDGATWTDLPGALNDTFLFDLAVYDAGGGDALYVCGRTGIHRHDGSGWTSIGNFAGQDFGWQNVHDMEVWNGELYAGGWFGTVDGIPCAGTARWNGTSWQPLGSGLQEAVNALALFDDGSGNGVSLYASGSFATGGLRAVARWDGTTWHPVAHDAGLVYGFEMVGFDDGLADAPALYMGGQIDHLDGVPSSNLARLGGCGRTGRLRCFGDGSGTPCPCGNGSSPTDLAGCTNSTGQAGALRASGSARITHDTLTLRASALPATTTTLFFQGNTLVNGGAGAVFGDGLRCAQGSVLRLGTRAASAGAVMLGADVPGDPALHVAGALTAAATRHYQAWYRNVVAFCSPAGFNLTNAVEIEWTH